MNKPILLLRLSYWAAAVADFGVAVLVWIPERMGLSETVYPMGLASAIAFSWGVLLLMADRDPFRRRWILIPTVLVIALLILVRIVFAWNESIQYSIPLALLGLALMSFLAYSYHYAGRLRTRA